MGKIAVGDVPGFVGSLKGVGYRGVVVGCTRAFYAAFGRDNKLGRAGVKIDLEGLWWLANLDCSIVLLIAINMK